MILCPFGGRLRRAAALVLLLGVTAGQHSTASAEIISDYDSSPGGVVVSDGGYDSGGSYEPYGSCDGYISDYGEWDGGAMSSCNDGCKHYCPIWAGGEWIRWRLDGNDLPPLVTDSPASTPLANAARLGEPGTRILSGDETVNDNWRNGWRVFGGIWLDDCRTCGVSVDYFDVGDDGYTFTSEDTPSRIVGRPFYNTELGEQDAQLVSVPNDLGGNVRVKSGDDFQGAGISLNRRIWQSCDPCGCKSHELTLLGGYRYYEYDSNLSIAEALVVLPGTTSPLVPGTTILVEDRFRTHNQFNGGELGFQCLCKRGCWFVDGTAKAAIGQTRRTVTVNGQTFVDVPGGGTSLDQGGLLTSEVTNIGRYDDTDFVIIPEFRLGLGTQLTNYCSIRAGYNVIIWSDVARAASHLPPGLQVDPRNLPPVQAGGGPDPEFPGIRGSQLLAHGFDVGVIFSF